MKYRIVRFALVLPILSVAISQMSAQRSVAANAELQQDRNIDGAMLARNISVNLQNVTVKEAVNTLAARANVRLQFRVTDLDAITIPVSLRASRISLGEALARVLVGTKLQAVPFSTDVVTIENVSDLLPVDGTIVGTVRHATTRQSIAGATIDVDGVTAHVKSNIDGTFRLTLAPGEHRITVRAVGFARYTTKVTVPDGNTISVGIDIIPSTSILDEVIVTGTVVATERKKIATPITVITAEDIEKRNITRLEQLFRGEVPGVVALDKASFSYAGSFSGQFQKTDVYSRGASDTRGGANPLKTFVDGVEVASAEHLGTIEMQSVERIEIITGPQAATVYGSGAMGGVMQIFTKKGGRTLAPTLRLTARYGIMENSAAGGRTPRHEDVLDLTGGDGAGFTYSGNLAYRYSGQWQPLLFSESYGLSFGSRYSQGAFALAVSGAATFGKNGTSQTPGNIAMIANGEIAQIQVLGFLSNRGITQQRVNRSNARNVSLNLSYRPASAIGHEIVIGESRNKFSLIPGSPLLMSPADTMFYHEANDFLRTTVSYTMTMVFPSRRIVGVSGSVGATAAMGEGVRLTGATVSGSGTSYTNPVVTKSSSSESRGLFGTWRFDFFRQLYYTAGFRVERNPTYGNKVKFDVTPSNGIAWTIERGELTFKLMGSYGRATRAPWGADGNADTWTFSSFYDPPRRQNTRYNPDLRPEYERGPQGGFEIFYGNRGSVSMNFYRGDVTDLSLFVRPVDSTIYREPNVPIDFYHYIGSWINVGTLKKRGVESTASMNLGPLVLRGTYSWNDSRISVVDTATAAVRSNGLYNNRSFTGIPTHTGYLNVSYAYDKLSLSTATSFIGQSSQPLNQHVLYKYTSQARLPQYVLRWQMSCPGCSEYVRSGYAKTDLAASYQVTPRASFLVNVTNLGNSYGSEQADPLGYPALGRVTTLGVTIRYPR